jgi:hypothetical protein
VNGHIRIAATYRIEGGQFISSTYCFEPHLGQNFDPIFRAWLQLGQLLADATCVRSLNISVTAPLGLKESSVSGRKSSLFD